MKVLKTIGMVLAIIFSLVYFFFLSGFMVLAVSRNIFSGNYYSSIINSIDLDEIKIGDMGELFEGSEFSSDMTLSDALVKSMTDGGVEEKTATAIIENKEIKNIVGNFIGDYINYSLGGEEPTIKRSDVKAVLNNPNIIEVAGKPTNEDIDEVYDELNDMVSQIIKGGN